MRKTIITKISHEIFLVGFITYVVYLGLELLFEGLISNYFDLNILLLVVIGDGMVIAFLGRKVNVL